MPLGVQPTIQELTAAIRSLASGKAVGPDGVSVELFKINLNGDPTLSQRLLDIIVRIWRGGLLLLFVVVFLTLTDPLRIQPWSQDRRNQTSNRKSEVSRESRQKRTDNKVASKGHRRDKIENKNKNTQTVETT